MCRVHIVKPRSWVGQVASEVNPSGDDYYREILASSVLKLDLGVSFLVKTERG